LNLFLAVLSLGDSFDPLDQVVEIDGLIYKLADYDLPPHTQKLLFLYFERTNRFAQAEDILDELVASTPGNKQIIENGISFYHRLQQKNTAILRAGNLTKDEVEEGLAKLMA
jgi:hypothetical protein